MDVRHEFAVDRDVGDEQVRGAAEAPETRSPFLVST
jgi:hypothetical protein